MITPLQQQLINVFHADNPSLELALAVKYSRTLQDMLLKSNDEYDAEIEYLLMNSEYSIGEYLSLSHSELYDPDCGNTDKLISFRSIDPNSDIFIDLIGDDDNFEEVIKQMRLIVARKKIKIAKQKIAEAEAAGQLDRK